MTCRLLVLHVFVADSLTGAGCGTHTPKMRDLCIVYVPRTDTHQKLFNCQFPTTVAVASHHFSSVVHWSRDHVTTAGWSFDGSRRHAHRNETGDCWMDGHLSSDSDTGFRSKMRPVTKRKMRCNQIRAALQIHDRSPKPRPVASLNQSQRRSWRDRSQPVLECNAPQISGRPGMGWKCHLAPHHPPTVKHTDQESGANCAKLSHFGRFCSENL